MVSRRFAYAFGAGLALALVWSATALDEGGKQDDFATAIILTTLIAGALAFGFVRRRWTAVAWVTAAFVLYLVVEQLRWEDDPYTEGMDDVEPLFAIIMTPFVALIGALGVVFGKAVAEHGTARGIGRVAAGLAATAALTTVLVLAWHGILSLTGTTGDCTRVACSPLADFTYDAGTVVILACALISGLVVHYYAKNGARRL